MYYLRTKSAVDAIKFILIISRKKISKVRLPQIVRPLSQKRINAYSCRTTFPQELKQMLSQAKDSEDDDCLMCGSKLLFHI